MKKWIVFFLLVFMQKQTVCSEITPAELVRELRTLLAGHIVEIKYLELEKLKAEKRMEELLVGDFNEKDIGEYIKAFNEREALYLKIQKLIKERDLLAVDLEELELSLFLPSV